MPFTMHGQDLTFINYFPMMFVEKGIWDPYGFISAKFPYFPATYYGPVLFAIMSAADFVIIKFFNPASLIAMLELSGTMLGKGFTTIDYVHAFSGLDLFKNLFLLKSPYLLFDFAIGFLLFKLAISHAVALGAYRLWMLNIVVLQSVYAVGGAYLITTFFIIASLYAAVKKKPYLCIVLLTLGGATQLFPYVLIPPACLILADTWKKRLSLLAVGIVSSALIYLPFYLSSAKSVLGYFYSSKNVQYSNAWKFILMSIFALLYVFVCMNAKKDSRRRNPGSSLLYYFAIILFLSYAAFPVRFRYFVFITPLLALLIPANRPFGIFVFTIIIMLAFQWLTMRDLQLGLFAPLNANYFLSLPTFQEVIVRFVNVEAIYKVIARVLPMANLAAACWVWRIKNREVAPC